MTTLVLFVLLFVLMALGLPIAVALGLSSLVTILFFAQDSLASLSLKLFETSEHYTLLSIPFFILGGAFMTTGGVADETALYLWLKYLLKEGRERVLLSRPPTRPACHPRLLTVLTLGCGASACVLRRTDN